MNLMTAALIGGLIFLAKRAKPESRRKRAPKNRPATTLPTRPADVIDLNTSRERS